MHITKHTWIIGFLLLWRFFITYHHHLIPKVKSGMHSLKNEMVINIFYSLFIPHMLDFILPGSAKSKRMKRWTKNLPQHSSSGCGIHFIKRLLSSSAEKSSASKESS